MDLTLRIMVLQAEMSSGALFLTSIFGELASSFGNPMKVVLSPCVDFDACSPPWPGAHEGRYCVFLMFIQSLKP